MLTSRTSTDTVPLLSCSAVTGSLHLAAILSQCLSLSSSSRYQSKTAKELLDTILSIQPKDSSGGGGETREAVVSRQAADMLEKLPPSYVPHEVLTQTVVLTVVCACGVAACKGTK